MEFYEINDSYNFSTNVVNDQHYQVHQRILAGMDAEVAATYHYDTFLTEYQETFLIEEEIYRPNTAFEESQELSDLDQQRDRRFIYVSQTITTAEYSEDEAVVEAGRKAAYVLAPYKLANTKEYNANSAQLTAFLKLATSAEYAPAFETLGLTQSLASLKELNDRFIEVYEQRDTTIAQRAQSETMRTIRPKVDQKAHDMFKVINALYLVNSLVTKDPEMEAALRQVIDFINERLISLSRIIDRQDGEGGGGSNTGGGTTPEDNTPEDDTTPGTDDQPVTPPAPDDNEGGSDTPDTPIPDDDEEVVG